MTITHHKNGVITTLVDEAPYHPGYEDAGFRPKLEKYITDDEIMECWDDVMKSLEHGNDLINFARRIIKKAQFL